MNKIELINLKNIFFFILFSIIPLTIILGPSISLSNILTINIIFLFFLIYEKKLSIFKNQSIKLLILIYLYLIFNSFISLDFEKTIARNFGFLRFILLFLVFNYFFYFNKKSENIFIIWLITIFFVVFDSYIEVFFGKNLLGYGSLYKERVVSFFKDEPIVGGYLNGFLFIIIGYLFKNYFEKKIILKLFLFSLIALFLVCIIFTGERSNGIKAIFGILLFFLLNQKINPTTKIISTILVLVISLIVISNSNYLKYRYYENIIQPILNSDKRENFLNQNIYIQHYKSGYAVFKNYPLFGVGNKNYRVETRDKQFTEDNYIPDTHPHQFYFEILSEHGIVGSMIFLGLLFFLVFKNLNVIIFSRNDIQLGCFIYLIINFLPLLPSGSFFGDFNSTLFWTNFSLMYACNPKTNIFKRE